MVPEAIQVSHSSPTEANDGVTVTGKHSFKKNNQPLKLFFTAITK
jgi:hypothetical protein